MRLLEEAPDASERETELRIRSRSNLGGDRLRSRKRTSRRLATRGEVICFGAAAEQNAKAGAIGHSA